VQMQGVDWCLDYAGQVVERNRRRNSAIRNPNYILTALENQAVAEREPPESAQVKRMKVRTEEIKREREAERGEKGVR